MGEVRKKSGGGGEGGGGGGGGIGEVRRKDKWMVGVVAKTVESATAADATVTTTVLLLPSLLSLLFLLPVSVLLQLLLSRGIVFLLTLLFPQSSSPSQTLPLLCHCPFHYSHPSSHFPCHHHRTCMCADTSSPIVASRSAPLSNQWIISNCVSMESIIRDSTTFSHSLRCPWSHPTFKQ